MIEGLDRLVVRGDCRIIDALSVVDAGVRRGVYMALVVDESNRFLGTVTDGDVRRGLLRGVTMDMPVSSVMNAKPAVVSSYESRETAVSLMQNLKLRAVPRVDEDGVLVGLELLNDEEARTARDTWVVLMAGGLGTRLHPLTKTVPKPMLPVGGRPLLETIVESLSNQGFRRIFLAVNYMAESIREHFGDGQWLGVEIDYLEEGKRLGTAGALGLLPERPKAPMVVMNGDLLTSVSLEQLLAFHRDHHATATVGVREYQMEVPYGVVETDGAMLTNIVEKPIQKYFVNAGIYVVEPGLLDLIPDDEFLDMPDLVARALSDGEPISTFPIREYWLDVGRLDDLERARAEYDQFFR